MIEKRPYEWFDAILAAENLASNRKESDGATYADLIYVLYHDENTLKFIESMKGDTKGTDEFIKQYESDYVKGEAKNPNTMLDFPDTFFDGDGTYDKTSVDLFVDAMFFSKADNHKNIDQKLASIMQKNGLDVKELWKIENPNDFHKVFDGIKAERKEKAEKADAEYLAWYEKSEKEKKMNETTALAVIPEVKVKQPTFLENLTDTAKSIPFKDVLERDDKITEVWDILSSKGASNNVILTGEAGVGKTAIIESLANQTAKGKVPEGQEGTEFYSLNINNMVQNTTLRGAAEANMKSVIDFIKSRKNAVLFIDEIHKIMGAGDTSKDNNNDFANVLKTELTNANFRVIGATTKDEYQKNIAVDKALIRRFTLVDVPELSPRASSRIAAHYMAEKYPDTKLKDSSVTLEATILAGRFLPNESYPSNVIKVLDNAVSSLKKGEILTTDNVKKTVSKLANVNEIMLSEDSAKIAKKIFTDTRKEISGQDEALLKLSEAIATSVLSSDSTRPLMVASISGGKGVGKTDTAKSIADSLGYSSVVMDMSEYTAESDTSKLFGTTPGFIGYGTDTPLIKAAREGNTVFVFKNMEKAHPVVADKLAKAISEGAFTTGGGENIKITNDIVLFTGAKEGEEDKNKHKMGFSIGQEVEEKGKKFKKYQNGSIVANLPKTLGNLVDYKVEFAPHSEASLMKIVDKEVAKLNDIAIKQGIPGFSMTKGAKTTLISQVDDVNEKGANSLKQAFGVAVRLPVIKSLPKAEKGKMIVVTGFDKNDAPVMKGRDPKAPLSREDVLNNTLDAMGRAKNYAARR